MSSTELTYSIFKIPISELFPKFKEHLDIPNNKRIFFSGKFGIGKTYFLNDFFNSSQDYEVFHLFPVNYQISSNEDVVEFLKYDILVELIKKNKGNFQDEDCSNFVDLQRLLYIWGKDNFSKIFKTGISYIPKLGRPLSDITDLAESFWKFKQKVESGDKGFVEDFLKKIKEKKVSETDYISELLKEKIIKQKDKKQSILVLDDLDRIDPEHIFRILNIFSVHLNLQNEESQNKFGFDKVILVADVNNLKNIFYHKYGENADFIGYFNKFFSAEIFQFQNEEVISKAVDEIISLSRIGGKGQKLGGALEKDGYLRIMLKDVLLKSLGLEGKNKLNLRQLFKGTRFEMPSFKNIDYKYNPSDGRDTVMPEIINTSVKIFISIFSGLNYEFVNVLKDIKNNYSKEKFIRAYDVFPYYLLKRVQPFSDKSDNLNISWNDYIIGFKDKIVASVTTPKNYNLEKGLSYLYFDLLIEYVSREIYKQKF